MPKLLFSPWAISVNMVQSGESERGFCACIAPPPSWRGSFADPVKAQMACALGRAKGISYCKEVVAAYRGRSLPSPTHHDWPHRLPPRLISRSDNQMSSCTQFVVFCPVNESDMGLDMGVRFVCLQVSAFQIHWWSLQVSCVAS